MKGLWSSFLATLAAMLTQASLPRVEAAVTSLDPFEIARRGKSLLAKDQKTGRGLVSLALHLNPFTALEAQFQSWLPSLLQSEPRSYWKGSVFIGHDKTFLESLLPRENIFRDQQVNFLGLITWRNLQLTGLSCCGIDNVAVFLQQANKHMYVAPFIDLVPGAGERLKPENRNMYKSFQKWWQDTGRRPMPEPSIAYKGKGRYEWPVMKVAFKSSRLPKGWPEFIEAVIAWRLEEVSVSKTCLHVALRKNPELKAYAEEYLPLVFKFIVGDPILTPPSLTEDTRKYVVCYNPHVGLGNLAVVMVSCKLLAKLTGRKMLLHWNVNTVSSEAFTLRESSPNSASLLQQYAEKHEVIFPGSVKHIYLFHMMFSEKLGEVLELLGCSNLNETLQSHPIVTVSSNMYFSEILRVNPNTQGPVGKFGEQLAEMFSPGKASAERALSFLRATGWGKLDWWGNSVPVVAVHVRAREEGEDNDDWPTAAAPDVALLGKLRNCLETAVTRELGGKTFDVFVAATTEAARTAVVNKLQGTPGLRNVLMMKDLGRNRKEESGAIDAMAEALLISRADVFVRLVVGTSGFSTFAFLSNALTYQNDWLQDKLSLKRKGPPPNYLVTEDCGKNDCFVAPTEVRMANIGWHGKQFTTRSCGDPVALIERSGSSQLALGCRGLRPVHTPAGPLGRARKTQMP
eukprot:CAMPEP_0206558354 /NCGR_PEP_ID=MMETSP0325_2-20121206/19703_1 /ASSEMBLY_ACC=CAM_ASM_000347 /TAXON_ID=2866 /ORGANISM="Crypthecodinium cohnii, Strain Seligo" /LENGTH=684 /DNA_ID=CAMNT_0054059557 /DNA_START=238 /DNA_END=2288 /DNA_ORIENTATION=-